MSIECLRDCNAACCHDVVILQPHSGMYEQMIKAGGNLEKVLLTDDGRCYTWKIVGLCPYLEDNKCNVRDNELLRPYDCGVLNPGSKICLSFRNRDGYMD